MPRWVIEREIESGRDCVVSRDTLWKFRSSGTIDVRLAFRFARLTSRIVGQPFVFGDTGTGIDPTRPEEETAELNSVKETKGKRKGEGRNKDNRMAAGQPEGEESFR